MLAKIFAVKKRIAISPALLALSVLGFLISACGGSKPVAYAPERLVPTEKALLWRISGNGLKRPSHLFGTIHLIPKSDFRLDAPTLAAINDARAVAFEIDMKEMTNLRAQFSLMTKAFMADGKTLRDLLPPDDYALVHDRLAENGMPPAMLERLKPMFLSTMLGSEKERGGLMGMGEKTTSVEMEIFSIAKKRKTPTAGLETAAYQLAIFDSIPYEAQAQMLVESLRAATDSTDELAQMVALYLTKDINAMAESIVGEDSGLKDYERLLLANRNRNWLAPMGRMMRQQPTFFAVGAGHLGGAQGVVALLRKQGYRVEAVE